MTGVNFFVTELAAKRLGLLRELLPAAARITGRLVNPANPTTAVSTIKDVQAAADGIRICKVHVLNASTILEIDVDRMLRLRDLPESGSRRGTDNNSAAAFLRQSRRCTVQRGDAVMSFPLSTAKSMPNFASQMRVAFASMASNTGSSSPGELEMTRSTSDVAVRCSREFLY